MTNIFEICRRIAELNGRCVNRFDTTIRIIYNDPFECDLEINYNKIGSIESLEVFFGGREVFQYCSNSEVKNHIVSGKWQELVDCLRDDIRPSDELLELCKAEAKKNRSSLKEICAEYLLVFNHEDELCDKELANTQKTFSYDNGGIFVELQKDRTWRILHVYHDNVLVFWYRWCSFGRSLACNKGILADVDWTEF